MKNTKAYLKEEDKWIRKVYAFRVIPWVAAALYRRLKSVLLRRKRKQNCKMQGPFQLSEQSQRHKCTPQRENCRRYFQARPIGINSDCKQLKTGYFLRKNLLATMASTMEGSKGKFRSWSKAFAAASCLAAWAVKPSPLNSLSPTFTVTLYNEGGLEP